MRKTILFLFAACVIFSTALQSAAQTQPQPPAKVLSIFREDIKAARVGAHAEHEAGYVRALQKAKWPVYGIALTSIAGPNDAWFVTGYESFDAMEKDHLAMENNAELMKEWDRLDAGDAEFRTGQRGIICVRQDDLSYRMAFDMSKTRYFQMLTVRVRPGHDREFREVAKLLRDAYEKAKADTHFIVYQVVAGLADGTYYVSIPLQSLKEIDDYMDPKNRAALMMAVGEENGKKIQKLFGDSIIGSDTSLYAVSPKMSYVPDDFARAGGEDFWRPKGMVAMPKAPKKPGAKTATAKQQ